MEEILVAALVEAVGAALAALVVLAVRRLLASVRSAPDTPASTTAGSVRLFAVPA